MHCCRNYSALFLHLLTFLLTVGPQILILTQPHSSSSSSLWLLTLSNSLSFHCQTMWHCVVLQLYLYLPVQRNEKMLFWCAQVTQWCEDWTGCFENFNSDLRNVPKWLRKTVMYLSQLVWLYWYLSTSLLVSPDLAPQSVCICIYLLVSYWSLLRFPDCVLVLVFTDSVLFYTGLVLVSTAFSRTCSCTSIYWYVLV